MQNIKNISFNFFRSCLLVFRPWLTSGWSSGSVLPRVGSLLSPWLMIFLHIKLGEEKFQKNGWWMRTAPPTNDVRVRWGNPWDLSFGSHGEGLLLVRRLISGISSPTRFESFFIFESGGEEFPPLFFLTHTHIHDNMFSTFRWIQKTKCTCFP